MENVKLDLLFTLHKDHFQVDQRCTNIISMKKCFHIQKRVFDMFSKILEIAIMFNKSVIGK